MSTTEPSPTIGPVKLYYYFWLPAGVDEFELVNYCDRHFENTSTYRVDIEGAIAQRLKDTLSKLRNASSDNLSKGFRLDKDPKQLSVQDGGLGLRKLEFDFCYDPAEPEPEARESQIYRLENQLTGHAIILSNGLYLWCFDIYYPSDLTPQVIFQSARKFLCDDFIKEHIAKLFYFD